MVRCLYLRYSVVACSIAKGDDHIQIVVRNHVCFAVCGSCSEFPNSCLLIEFSLLEDMLDMLADIRLARLVQFAHLSLCEPQRLLFKLYVNLGRAVIGRVYDDFVLLYAANQL